MRKIKNFAVAALMLVLAAALFTGCGDSAKHKQAIEKYGSDKLTIYMPSEYIGDDVVKNFEKEFGVTVTVELFDSNEMMYTKLAAGDSYDLLIPSDYMIERLLSEDKLQKIDKEMVPNLSLLAGQVLNLSYDANNEYSVPYFWGNVGIVYNTKNVSLEDLENEGFAIMKNTKYKGKIYMYDSERDSFMIALKSLGYSMNTENEDEINAAYDWLVEISKTMDPDYVGDEVIDGMMNGNNDLAIVYSGDAVMILDENEDMGFYVPSQGTNVWVDAMVIPKNASNPKLACEFMNYICSADVAYENTEAVGYASANKEILKKASEELFADNDAYVPREGHENDEFFHFNQTITKKLAELWIKVKAAK